MPGVLKQISDKFNYQAPTLGMVYVHNAHTIIAYYFNLDLGRITNHSLLTQFASYVPRNFSSTPDLKSDKF